MNISFYISTDNKLSGDKPPAILLDAKIPKDLDANEEDLTKLYNAYLYANARWNFSSDYIVDQLFNKYGTETDLMVEPLYFALGGDFGRTFGPAIGRLFERIAVKPGFITKHGLTCNSVDTIKSKIVHMTLGKGCTVKDCTSDKVIPISEIVQKCTNPKVIYNFARENEGFDCFIPPNNFIGFAQRIQTGEKKGNHSISQSFALQCCQLIDGPINYITAVPAHQVSIWKEQRRLLMK